MSRSDEEFEQFWVDAALERPDKIEELVSMMQSAYQRRAAASASDKPDNYLLHPHYDVLSGAEEDCR